MLLIGSGVMFLYLKFLKNPQGFSLCGNDVTITSHTITIITQYTRNERVCRCNNWRSVLSSETNTHRRGIGFHKCEKFKEMSIMS